MSEVVANFLVRITFITTATDHAQYMTKRCLNLLQRTMTLWPSAPIRIEHFQKLFQRGSSSSSSSSTTQKTTSAPSTKTAGAPIKRPTVTAGQKKKQAAQASSSKSSSPSPRMQYTCVQVLDAILRTGTNRFVQNNAEQFVDMLAPCFDIRAPEMQTLLQVFFTRLASECSKGRRLELRHQLVRGMTKVLSRAVRDTMAGRGERAYVIFSLSLSLSL